MSSTLTEPPNRAKVSRLIDTLDTSGVDLSHLERTIERSQEAARCQETRAAARNTTSRHHPHHKRSHPARGTVPAKPEQEQLARLIGRRMREAREMQGLNQVVAAKRLGYSNSSKLAKVERVGESKASASVPLWLLRRAAMVYQVSLDYLFGITETMETDEPRRHAQEELILLMREEWERQRWRDMLVTRSVQERADTVEQTIGLLEEQVEEAVRALERVRELNAEQWEELAGVPKLERLLNAVRATVGQAKARRQLLRPQAKQQSQLDLELIYG